MGKSLVFTPGCEWEVKSGVLFIEYESMTGEYVRARFDLSSETTYITDGYKLETIRNICEHSDDFSIRKVEYYEIENHMLVGDKMLVPTKVYFEAKAKKTAEKTYNKLVLPNTNSAYGIASRDWGDVLAESARYVHMQRSRCSGKTLWLSSATSFADEQPLCKIADYYHDICEQWLKTPPEPYEFISDDLEDCEKGVPNTKLIDPNRYLDTTAGETTSFYGVKSITPKPMHFRGKTWTHPESSYGKKGHMLIVDINSQTFVPDDDYLDVEVGDVMWYDDGNDGKNEPDDHGKLFVWRGLGIGWQKLSDGNGYLDTDMASSLQAKLMKSIENSKYGISFSDGDTVKKIKKFEEEIKMAEKTRFDMYKPKISKVIFNDPATIVMWSDGTKTVVKCGENDIFDPEKGVAMACMKKLLGTNKTGSNYLDKVQEYFDAYDGEQLEKCLAVRQRFMKFLAGCVKNGTDSKNIPPEVTVDKEFEAVTSNDWTVVPADENTTAEEDGE